MKHKWVKNNKYSIKCEAGHHITCSYHSNGITMFSLFPNGGNEGFVFNTAKEAKGYCDKEYPAKGVSS